MERRVCLPQDSPKAASSSPRAPDWAPLPMSLCGTRAAEASWVIRTWCMSITYSAAALHDHTPEKRNGERNSNIINIRYCFDALQKKTVAKTQNIIFV